MVEVEDDEAVGFVFGGVACQQKVYAVGCGFIAADYDAFAGPVFGGEVGRPVGGEAELGFRPYP